MLDALYAVVPYYFLVWYNPALSKRYTYGAVVPYYFLVWYNRKMGAERLVAL